MRWLALLAAVAWAAPGAAACRQALVLAVDISGSVDNREHRLQREGMAQALLDPEVMAAFLGVPEAPVRLLIFEWAGPDNQAVVIDWAEVRTETDLHEMAARLRAVPRAEGGTRTATGDAMAWAGGRLQEQADCERLTLDVSTDGLHNIGIDPATARARVALRDVTVNALAIGTEWPGEDRSARQLSQIVAYLNAEVIQGHGAFVEVATDFDHFAPAIRRKLLRELQSQVLGGTPAPGAAG